MDAGSGTQFAAGAGTDGTLVGSFRIVGLDAAEVAEVDVEAVEVGEEDAFAATMPCSNSLIFAFNFDMVFCILNLSACVEFPSFIPRTIVEVAAVAAQRPW